MPNWPMALADVGGRLYGAVDVSDRRLGGGQKRGVGRVAFGVRWRARKPHRFGQLTRHGAGQSAARAMRVFRLNAGLLEHMHARLQSQ